jgi:hypothetical protein
MTTIGQQHHQEKREVFLTHVPERTRAKLAEIKDALHKGGSLPLQCPHSEAATVEGQPGNHCRVEDQLLTPTGRHGAAMALSRFCCDEYGECPSFQAAANNDPIVEEQRKAKEARATEAQTQRQIATGMRVDDRRERARKEHIENLDPVAHAHNDDSIDQEEND